MRKRIVPLSRHVVSLILSLIYCGLGQLYNRQIAKGLDFIIIYTILIASYFSPIPMLRVVGLSLLPLMWFIGMVDAYMSDEITVDKTKMAAGYSARGTYLSYIPHLFFEF